MRSKEKIAFIDETGQSQLDTDIKDISDYYILAAIVIDREDHQQTFAHFDLIVERYFSKTGEMKSGLRSLKKKPDRRIEILETIAEINFSLYLYIVNKKEINKDSGSQWPKSFIKHFHKRLFERIIEDHNITEIIGDEIKTKNFCVEFKKYIEEQFSSNNKGKVHGKLLYDPFKINLVPSKDNVGVQASDFIAGTVALGFEAKTSQLYHERHKEILSPHIIDTVVWPERYEPYTVGESKKERGQYDHAIELRAMAESSKFIDNYKDSEEQHRKEQVLLLYELRQAIFSHGVNYWVQRRTILDSFYSVLNVKYDAIPRGIIGGLRDAGVLIVSRTNGGYKLAASKVDYHRYLDLVTSQISPMIHRVIVARDIIKRATENNVDILDEQAYSNLREIVKLDCPLNLNTEFDDN